MASLSLDLIKSLANADGTTVDIVGYFINDYLKSLSKRDFIKLSEEFNELKSSFDKEIKSHAESVSLSKHDDVVRPYIMVENTNSINEILSKTKIRHIDTSIGPDYLIIEGDELESNEEASKTVSRSIRYIFNGVFSFFEPALSSFMKDVDKLYLAELMVHLLIGVIFGSYAEVVDQVFMFFYEGWLSDEIKKKVDTKEAATNSSSEGLTEYVYVVDAQNSRSNLKWN